MDIFDLSTPRGIGSDYAHLLKFVRERTVVVNDERVELLSSLAVIPKKQMQALLNARRTGKTPKNVEEQYIELFESVDNKLSNLRTEQPQAQKALELVYGKEFLNVLVKTIKNLCELHTLTKKNFNPDVVNAVIRDIIRENNESKQEPKHELDVPPELSEKEIKDLISSLI